MSFFSNRLVCEQTKFHSLNIDPQQANEDGVLTIANGHTTVATAPDQRYTLAVDSSSGYLSLTGQSVGPSPASEVFEIRPNGGFDFKGNAVGNVATPTQNTDVATKQYVDNAVSGGGGNPKIMTNEGTWSSTVTYSQNDVVLDTSSNDYYVSIVDNNVNRPPYADISGQFWKAFYTLPGTLTPPVVSGALNFINNFQTGTTTAAKGSIIIGSVLINYGLTQYGASITETFNTPFKAGTQPVLTLTCAQGNTTTMCSIDFLSTQTPNGRIDNTGFAGNVFAMGVLVPTGQSKNAAFYYLAIGAAP